MTPGGPFAGRFHVLGSLGAGATAAVHRARDEALGREVALKVAAGRIDAARLARFRREGELTAALRHPGIVTVHAAGVEDGRPWIAYELVDGRPLTDHLRAWPLRRRVEAVRDAARALGHAHARGVVHRDVKPDNLLVDGDGHVRVADFGVATAVDLDRLTRTGALVGTPTHMAPEQARGAEVGPPTDVWALGVVLYEALTGELPFGGDHLLQVLAAIERAEVTPPRALAPDAPIALEAVCLRALARAPTDRYPHGDALADALAAALDAPVARAAGRRWAPPALAAAAAALGLGAAALLGSPPPTVAPPLPPPPGPPVLTPAPVATASTSSPLRGPPRRIEEVPPPDPERARPPAGSPLDPWAPTDDPDGGLTLVLAGALRRTDPLAAASLYRWAAERAAEPIVVGRAWYELGRLFESGAGVARSLEAASACYRAGARVEHISCLVRCAADALRAGPAGEAAADVLLRRALVGLGDEMERDHAVVALARVAVVRPDLVTPDEARALLSRVTERRRDARLTLGQLAEQAGDVAAAETIYSQEIARRDDAFDAHARLVLLQARRDPARPAAPLGGPRDPTWRALFAEIVFAEAEGELRARAVDLLRELAAAAGAPARRAALSLGRLHLDEREAGRAPPISAAEARLHLRRAAAEVDDVGEEARRALARFEER